MEDLQAVSKSVDGKPYDSEVIDFLLNGYFTEMDEASLVYDSYICLFGKHPSIDDAKFLADHYYGYFMGLDDLIYYLQGEKSLGGHSFCVVCPDSESPMTENSSEGFFKIVDGKANALFYF